MGVDFGCVRVIYSALTNPAAGRRSEYLPPTRIITASYASRSAFSYSIYLSGHPDRIAHISYFLSLFIKNFYMLLLMPGARAGCIIRPFQRYLHGFFRTASHSKPPLPPADASEFY